MPADVAEPPVTTSSFSPKPSFLEDDNLNKDLEAALAADGKLSPTVPSLTDKPAAIAPAPDKPAEQTPPKEATPKPGDATPADDDKIPDDIKSPAGQSSWKRLKDAKKAVETELATVKSTAAKEKAELEALRAAAKTPQQKANLAEDPEYIALKKQYEARDKEAKDLDERLRIVDVERHPKFEAYFKEKTEQQMAIAKDIGGEKLLEVLQLPDSQYRKEKLNEVVAEMNPVDIATLGSVITRLREINSEKQSEIAKARASFEQIQAEQKANGEKQRNELLNTFQRVTKDVTDKEKGLSVFQERDGDEEWNKGVRERMSLAQAAFEGRLKPEDAARAIYWAAAAPQFLQHNNALMAKVAELEKTITALRASAPNPAGGNGDPDPAPKSDKRGLDAMMESIEQAMPR